MSEIECEFVEFNSILAVEKGLTQDMIKQQLLVLLKQAKTENSN